MRRATVLTAAFAWERLLLLPRSRSGYPPTRHSDCSLRSVISWLPSGRGVSSSRTVAWSPSTVRLLARNSQFSRSCRRVGSGSRKALAMPSSQEARGAAAVARPERKRSVLSRHTRSQSPSTKADNHSRVTARTCSSSERPAQALDAINAARKRTPQRPINPETHPCLDPLSRSAPHVRHPAGRLGAAAAHDPGVPRPRRRPDDTDLHPLRPLGARGRRAATRADGVQFGVQFEGKWVQLSPTALALESQIRLRDSRLTRLGAGRSQVQILSPRPQGPARAGAPGRPAA
jgi:hypothetical protein